MPECQLYEHAGSSQGPTKREGQLLSEIERPPYHYFGDELEIDVLSVSPSGQEFL